MLGSDPADRLVWSRGCGPVRPVVSRCGTFLFEEGSSSLLTGIGDSSDVLAAVVRGDGDLAMSQVVGMVRNMEPMYSRNGEVVAWLESDRLRSLAGEVIGWLCGDGVYSLQGRSIGYFNDGAFRDQHGAVAGFIRGASPGIAMPGLAGVPGQPGLAAAPGRPVLSGRTARQVGAQVGLATRLASTPRAERQLVRLAARG